MERYTNYCTCDQTRRALELGAPIEFNELVEMEKTYEEQYFYKKDNRYYEIPTTQQMFGWFRNKNIFINILHYNCGYNYMIMLIKPHECIIDSLYNYETYEEVEYAAINAVLKYLEKKGK